jgi:hypothetical protein
VHSGIRSYSPYTSSSRPRSQPLLGDKRTRFALRTSKVAFSRCMHLFYPYHEPNNEPNRCPQPGYSCSSLKADSAHHPFPSPTPHQPRARARQPSHSYCARGARPRCTHSPRVLLEHPHSSPRNAHAIAVVGLVPRHPAWHLRMPWASAGGLG